VPQVFCVVDTLGAGRIVGVFTSRALAAKVAAVDPSYYQLHVCPLDELNPDALDWAQTDKQRARLAALMRRGR
jgi:hypothetical protein